MRYSRARGAQWLADSLLFAAGEAPTPARLSVRMLMRAAATMPCSAVVRGELFAGYPTKFCRPPPGCSALGANERGWRRTTSLPPGRRRGPCLHSGMQHAIIVSKRAPGLQATRGKPT